MLKNDLKVYWRSLFNYLLIDIVYIHNNNAIILNVAVFNYILFVSIVKTTLEGVHIKY